jgi:uncharacterized protein
MVFDPIYLWLIFIPTLVVSFGVQMYLRSTYSKWSKVPNGYNLPGKRVADELFDRTSLMEIPLEVIPGNMTDHFDPAANVVRLSQGTAGQPSVASMAIAAHELGHVQQYQTGSALIKARGFLLPALRFSPTLSYIGILFGLMFNIAGLYWLGVLFFGLMVLFSILTLPVEFDASKRGIRLLTDAGLIQSEKDRVGAKAVLRAAALTYIAAAITSIMQLLYYISLGSRRR